MAGSRISRELQLLLTGKDVSWSKTTRGAQSSLGKLNRAGAKAGSNMTRNLQHAAVAGGLAAAGAAAFAVNAAMDFESSSASVRKTVDGNVESILAANRALSKTTGLEVNALNEIAATAGALGVAKDDVDDFTKTVAILGVTTDDVTTELGATSLGHLSTTLRLAGTDFEHLGNDLVFLGNHGASTEGQILSMTENIAGAANVMGASTPQVLGWAAALANTGEEAEAGGSSIQRFWLGSFKAVNEGGSKLKLMAKITGTTAKGFKTAFGKDATGTLAKFLVKLGKLSKAEQLATLSALGFKDIRITRALLKLLANTDNLTDSLGNSEKGWNENKAASEEAAKRFETTASKLAILKANVNDAAITIGSELLPVLAELSTDAVAWISAHQGEIKEFSKDLASGVREAVTWAQKLDWDAIGSAMGLAAGAAKGILEAFLGMPSWVQAAVLTGWGLNKFTGGAVVDFGKIAFDQFAGRGASPANPLWVQSVGLPGGLPGGKGGGIPGWSSTAGGTGGLSGLAQGLPMIGIAVIAAEAAQTLADAALGEVKPILKDLGVPVSPGTDVATGTGGFFVDLLTGHPFDALGRLPGIADDIGQLASLIGKEPSVAPGPALQDKFAGKPLPDKMRESFDRAKLPAVTGKIVALQDNIDRGTADVTSEVTTARRAVDAGASRTVTAAAGTTMAAQSAGTMAAMATLFASAQIVAAIERFKPVTVSPTTIERTTVIQHRTGPSSGSRNVRPDLPV